MTHSEALHNWYEANGDSTLIFDHRLNENSVVMDLGGYTGNWGKEVSDKYNCNLYIIEPIFEFYKIARDKFIYNEKVILKCCGVSNETGRGVIYKNTDRSSSSEQSGPKKMAFFKTVDEIFALFGLNHVDLVQMNIEGDEYKVLENMLSTGVINKIRNIQVQFHIVGDDYNSRRNRIHQGLSENGFVLKYNFPFIWEAWEKR